MEIAHKYMNWAKRLVPSVASIAVMNKRQGLQDSILSAQSFVDSTTFTPQVRIINKIPPEQCPRSLKIMERINESGSVVGTIIVNIEGFPETTTLDSLTATTYATVMKSIAHHAKNALQEIDVTDELEVLRVISKKTEVVVAPDEEFHLVVVMRSSEL